MKSLSRQSDRAIQDLLGIDSSCSMCDLLHIDIERQRDTTLDREIRLLFLIRLMLDHKRQLNMWKLAAFAGLIGTLMFAWVSLHHA